MRHFIQYHNPDSDSRGPYRPGRGFGIVTDKPVDTLRNDRVWLITGEGTPKRYFLCETFVVEEIDRIAGPQRNIARASEGLAYRHPIRIDTCSWFKDLRRATGNFAFGLQRMKSEKVIRGLLRLSTTDVDESKVAFPSKTGAGFGTAAENRLVEQAAVRAVTRYYESRGWRVKSRERLCLGYDLCCTRGTSEEHVEVKGIRGALCSFLITSNEKQAAKVDPFFKLCAVTNALTPSRRKICRFEGAALLTSFDLQPVAFVAKPKDK